jgi:hypothetical protein
MEASANFFTDGYVCRLFPLLAISKRRVDNDKILSADRPIAK